MTLFLVLFLLGMAIYLLASIWLIVLAFKESVLWGLGCIFLPFVQLVFVIKFWDETKTAVITIVVGLAMLFGAGTFAPDPQGNAAGTGSGRSRWWNAFSRASQTTSPPEGEPAPAPKAVSPNQSSANLPAAVARPPALPAERKALLEREIPRRTAELATLFQSLSAQRTSLPPGDQKALAAYNAEAARYAALLAEARAMKAELDGVPVVTPPPLTALEAQLGYRDVQLTEIESERAVQSQRFSLTLRPLLAKRDFSAIDRWAGELRTSRAECGDGTLHLAVLYDALAELPETALDPAWKERVETLTEWTRKAPKSVAARIALAGCWSGWALKARGGKYVNAVSAEGLRLMKDRFEKAEKILEEAGRLGEKCPVLADASLLVSVFTKRDRAAFERAYRAAHQADPKYTGYYIARTLSLHPNLYGKPGELQQFVTDAANKLAGEDGDILYARIAWWLRVAKLYPTLQEARLDWPRVRTGLQAILRRQPQSVGAASLLCTLAAENGDRALAKQLFTQVGTVIDLSAFLSRERFLRERSAVFR